MLDEANNSKQHLALRSLADSPVPIITSGPPSPVNKPFRSISDPAKPILSLTALQKSLPKSSIAEHESEATSEETGKEESNDQSSSEMQATRHPRSLTRIVQEVRSRASSPDLGDDHGTRRRKLLSGL